MSTVYEIWTKEFGQVTTAPTATDALRLLKQYAAEAGTSVTLTFMGGWFQDDEGRRYVIRKVTS